MYDPRKRKMIRAGRRSGKTTAFAMLSCIACEKEKKRVLYAVPTTEQLDRWWHEVCLSMSELIEFGVVRKYEGDHVIEHVGTEQAMRGKTAWNADTLRGDYGDLIILDEFQLMNEDALQDVVYPMLIDNNGDLVLGYTPPSLHSRSTSKATDKRHAAKLFKEKLQDPRWLCLHWSSMDNPYVSPTGIQEIARDMTALSYRQEIEAQDIDEVPGALWKLQTLDTLRLDAIPPEALPFAKIVVAVDPTGSTTNEAGIVGAALGKNAHGYLLADRSKLFVSPRAWGQEAAWLYWELRADALLGERNYGGDMIRDLIATVDENIRYKDVTATKGKDVRAEPIAALYEKGMIHHVGDPAQYEKLEEEMTSYVPILSKTSPNRMDALVWAFTELFPENTRLALVEYVQEEMQKRKTESQGVAKVQVNDKTERCPMCNYHGIARRGPISRCSSCGHEWGAAIRPKEDDEEEVPRPRAELFRGKE